MSTETAKVRAKVAALSASLDKLERELAPLLDRPLAETLAGLEPIEQARLQTLLPYIIYDLSFIQLKTHGVDPKTHPVISELDRVRQYFEKIKKVEDTTTRQSTVDKDAAARFIKHAINSVQYKRSDPPQDAPSTSAAAAPVPVKVTDKMREREQYLREMQERDGEESSEDEGLQVIEGEDAMEIDSALPKNRKGKGKATAGTSNADQAAVDALRKRRQKSNPFGNDDPSNAPSMDVDGLEEVPPPESAVADASAPNSKSKKKRRKSATGETDADAPKVSAAVDELPKKKKKKKAKKE
ncbi:Sas10/Utp3/C1D family-domain-containing protein [Schizophyllum fasciatum]